MILTTRDRIELKIILIKYRNSLENKTDVLSVDDRNFANKLINQL